ncbi:MAG: GIY-YIG nuclease family protein [Deltaproteobacteria bacterium]|nr:GIY-YIG nuclease family protein [Deltaproteobacteria bacterium]
MAGRKNLFDRKFGEDFIKGVPRAPGVYEMLDALGTVLYVGKAKILRRRLQQYRNARRCKRHHKMRSILDAAHSLRTTACATDLDALLLENKLIQELRPRFNVAGAFSFLYPCIGVVRSGRELHLCYSTTPGEFPMFDFYGAYRSRQLTKEGFDALLEVMGFIGHREPSKKVTIYPRVRFSVVAVFRQVGDEWLAPLDGFLRGDSKAFLEQAVLALLEKPYARRHAEETQEHIDALARFFKFEAKPLRKALASLGIAGKLVSQDERDRLFLKSRHAPAERRARPPVSSSSRST